MIGKLGDDEIYNLFYKLIKIYSPIDPTYYFQDNALVKI